jgi:hypothetical protein
MRLAKKTRRNGSVWRARCRSWFLCWLSQTYQCRDLQRKPRQGRRAILQEGLESLPRGPVADAQNGRTRAASIGTRPSGAAALPRRTAIAGLARRRRGSRQLPRGRGFPRLRLQPRRDQRASSGVLRRGDLSDDDIPVLRFTASFIDENGDQPGVRMRRARDANCPTKTGGDV